MHQHPVQMVVRNALLWAPVRVRLLLEMDESHTATAQTRVGNLIELKEGGQLIYTICGKRNVTEDEQSVRRVCVCVCVKDTKRECVCHLLPLGVLLCL